MDDTTTRTGPNVAAPKRGRGRPRSPQLEQRMVTATLEVLAQTGFSGLTVDEICARAGVHKTSFYRRWANATEAAIDAVGANFREVLFNDTGDLAADLLTYLKGEIALSSDPLVGVCQRLFVAEASVQPELKEMQTRGILARRERNLARLNQALVGQGLSQQLDAELLLISVTGVAFIMASVGWPLSDAQLKTLIAALIRPPG